MQSTVSTELKNAVLMIIGSFLIALGVVAFLQPNMVATGGAPGMAILIHHLFGSVSLGLLMLLINVPLLLLGMRYLGRAFGIRTILSIIMVSVFTDGLKIYFGPNPISGDLLLATLFGGIIIGLGVGCILRGNSSAGGSTIIARVLAARYNIKPGHSILCIDALIILSSAFVFKGVEQSLWSLISIYATSRCIDVVLTGGPSEKVVHIVSQNVDLLSREIIAHLGPNGTILSGVGMQNQERKTMIFVTIEAGRITVLRDIIRHNDPEAFMVVMDASEMLGRGH